MSRLKTAAVLAELIDRLVQAGSWTGETHVQKSTYLLEMGTHAPLDFDFVLYKHGPFSFDLKDELTDLRADGILALEARPYPYGPSFRTSPDGEVLKARFPQTLAEFKPLLDWVIAAVDKRDVSDLERLSTSLYIMRTEGTTDPTSIAERLVELKPHVSLRQAQVSAEELLELMRRAPSTA